MASCSGYASGCANRFRTFMPTQTSMSEMMDCSAAEIERLRKEVQEAQRKILMGEP